MQGSRHRRWTKSATYLKSERARLVSRLVPAELITFAHFFGLVAISVAKAARAGSGVATRSATQAIAGRSMDAKRTTRLIQVDTRIGLAVALVTSILARFTERSLRQMAWG